MGLGTGGQRKIADISIKLILDCIIIQSGTLRKTGTADALYSI